LPEKINARLQTYLADRYSEAVISDLEFLVSGFESDVFTFTLQEGGGDPKAYVLRLHPGDGSKSKMMREANGLGLLRQAGYPVPAMLLYEPDASFLGSPFTILEKLEGRSMWPVLAGAEPEYARQLLDGFSSLLARLHRLDWRPFTDQAAHFEHNPGAVLDDHLADMRALFQKFAMGGFLPIVDWLENQRSAIRFQPAVVHLDFHANNVFVCQDGHLAVIDWTQITVSDFRTDLSWSLMIMGDFGQPAWGERILHSYELASENKVEDLDYFNIINYTKLLSSSMISLRNSPGELGMRSETAQTIEQQRPMLLMLSQRIRRITGLSIPEVERVLDGSL
jgi:aminoglycoside phosphotransferase (APT) family kinase protein